MIEATTGRDMPAASELARAADAATRAVPGVAELYYAAPLPARLWRTVAGAESAYCAVSRRGGITETTVSIGVDLERLDEVTRAVADRVRAVLGDLGAPDVRVTVRVGRIAGRAPSPAAPGT